MTALHVPLLLLLFTSSQPGKNLLQDPGFEKTQKPDQYGNPFQKWGGWKWEGNCERRADSRVRHGGKTSGLLAGRNAGKIAFMQNLSVEPGWYRLSGWIRWIGLRRGTWDRTAMVALEPPDQAAMEDPIPEGNSGWRRFERAYHFEEAIPKLGLYIYLFGPGLLWVDDLAFEKLPAGSYKKAIIFAKPDEALIQNERGEPCPACGLRIDPAQATCPFCGETVTGLADRPRALEAVKSLEAKIREAHKRGLETAYQEIVPIVARLGLEARWGLPEQAPHRPRYVEWTIRECARASRQLDEILSGKRKPLAFVPLPDPRDLELDGGYLRSHGEPVFLLAMNGGGSREARKKHLFGPVPAGFASAVGGTRYDYRSQPIWSAFQSDPGTHRVGWRGWCGHIIRDRWSIGGDSGDVLICLESPHTREAVVEYFKKRVPALMRGGVSKYYDMDFEFAYVCFCDRTRAMFRNWLKKQYGKIARVNEVWGTSHKSFDAVPLPGDAQPKAATDRNIERVQNRAFWYDFARFNGWRFTEYMVWARQEIRKIDPGALVMTGAPFYMLSANAGWTGIDTELLNLRVNDVVLNECHASTVTTDLLNSIAGGEKLHQDREYHGDIAHVFPQFLHGMGYLNMWHWPASPTFSPRSFYLTDVAHSPVIPLSDVALVLRDALDLRRLGREVLSFHAMPSSFAILYSMDSLLQVEPRLRTARDCPHSFALKALYEGSVYNDTPVRFTTQRKIARGDLAAIRVLALPAVEYLNRETEQAIMAWTRSGGTLLLTPSSLLGDQYARNARYLQEIGVTIKAMRVPRGKVVEGKPDVERATGFIMGPLKEEELEKIPRERLSLRDEGLASTSGGLEGWGLQQIVEASASSTVIAALKDGNPAILRVPAGKGTIYYLATPLTEESYHRFFDWLLNKEKFQRPVRVLDSQGRKPFRVDSRTVKSGGNYLTCIVNLNPDPVALRLETELPVGSVTDLITGEPVTGLALDLARHERAILRIELSK